MEDAAASVLVASHAHVLAPHAAAADAHPSGSVVEIVASHDKAVAVLIVVALVSVAWSHSRELVVWAVASVDVVAVAVAVPAPPVVIAVHEVGTRCVETDTHGLRLHADVANARVVVHPARAGAHE